jgi:hypothetical protein
VARFHLHHGDTLDAYPNWPAPTAIISDGAYGLSAFPGDPAKPDRLADWYAPHIEAWTAAATPETTLWFWCTEVGWANVHPALVEQGWRYVQLITWDKGVAHVAGNVNSNTIRRFPVVTEVCAFYSRPAEITSATGSISVQQWLRDEWRRTGLPLSEANSACGVADAATRKYLTLDDDVWYPPPPIMLERLVQYANAHGNPTGRPYFSLDGTTSIDADDLDTLWSRIRHPWTHQHGLTNVWQLGALRGAERIKVPGGGAVHLNQKPLELMRRILTSATRPGDVVWEPFGGLCSASVAAIEMECIPYAAERHDPFHAVALDRLRSARVSSNDR